MESTGKIIDIIKEEKQTNPGQLRKSGAYKNFNLKYNKDLKYI